MDAANSVSPLVVLILGIVIGAALGLWGYRSMLKRNPEKLEAWAKRLKELK